MFEGVKAWFEGMGVGFQLARDGWTEMVRPTYSFFDGQKDRTMETVAGLRGTGGMLLFLALWYFSALPRDVAERTVEDWAVLGPLETMADGLIAFLLVLVVMWIVSVFLLVVARPGNRKAVFQCVQIAFAPARWMIMTPLKVLLPLLLVDALAVAAIASFLLPEDWWPLKVLAGLALLPLGIAACVLQGALIGLLFYMGWIVLSGSGSIATNYFRAIDGHPTMRALIAIGVFGTYLAFGLLGFEIFDLGFTESGNLAPTYFTFSGGGELGWYLLTVPVPLIGVLIAIWELRRLHRVHGATVRSELTYYQD